MQNRTRKTKKYSLCGKDIDLEPEYVIVDQSDWIPEQSHMHPDYESETYVPDNCCFICDGKGRIVTTDGLSDCIICVNRKSILNRVDRYKKINSQENNQETE